ncbi:MAG: hypothetical protein EXR21_05570 [Flavobacteriaceae bacterium]|nr:hypothetical protein [Flavobacteriaceae bacterium]
MKKILTIAFLSIVLFCSSCQRDVTVTISGQITDELTSRPVECTALLVSKAHVPALNAGMFFERQKLVTDANGNYIFTFTKSAGYSYYILAVPKGNSNDFSKFMNIVNAKKRKLNIQLPALGVIAINLENTGAKDTLQSFRISRPDLANYTDLHTNQGIMEKLVIEAKNTISNDTTFFFYLPIGLSNFHFDYMKHSSGISKTDSAFIVLKDTFQYKVTY